MEECHGVRLDNLWEDFLHDGYLGCCGNHVANHGTCLVEYDVLRDSDGDAFVTVDQSVDYMNEKLVRYCKDSDVKRPPSKLSLLAFGRKYKTDQPELSSKFKGAHVKILVGFIADLAYTTYSNLDFASEPASEGPRPEITKEMADLLITNTWALAEFIYVMDICDFWLSEHDAKRMQHAGMWALLNP
jgi:hypothetical protein